MYQNLLDPQTEIMKVSFPPSPVNVSTPAPPIKLYELLPPADDMLIVPPPVAAVRLAVPELVVLEVCCK